RPGEIDGCLVTAWKIDRELANGLFDARLPQAPEEHDLSVAPRWPTGPGVEGDDLSEPPRPSSPFAPVVLEVALTLLRRRQVAAPRPCERLLGDDRRRHGTRLDQR